MTQLRTDKKAHALRGTAAFIVAVFSAALTDGAKTGS